MQPSSPALRTGSTNPPAPEEKRPEGKRRRVILLCAVAASAVLVAGGLGAARRTGRAAADKTADPVAPAAPAGVTRGDISTARTLPGTLGFGPARTITGSGNGVLTWLPAAGATIARGQRVYAVDDQ